MPNKRSQPPLEASHYIVLIDNVGPIRFGGWEEAERYARRVLEVNPGARCAVYRLEATVRLGSINVVVDKA